MPFFNHERQCVHVCARRELGDCVHLCASVAGEQSADFPAIAPSLSFHQEGGENGSLKMSMLLLPLQGVRVVSLKGPH